LPLKTGLNPAHAAAVATLLAAAVQPLLGDRSELTEADWAALQAKLAAYETWKAAKAGARWKNWASPASGRFSPAKRGKASTS
jgi:gamma-glutamyl:cysteine ligase YbdK (ATP-grasp superfamily)